MSTHDTSPSSDDDVVGALRRDVERLDLPPDRTDLAAIVRRGRARRRWSARPALALVGTAAAVAGIAVAVVTVQHAGTTTTSSVATPQQQDESPVGPQASTGVEATPPSPGPTQPPSADELLRAYYGTSDPTPVYGPSSITPDGVRVPDYDVPDLLTSLAALPPGLVWMSDPGQYVLQPTVPGQGCGRGDAGAVAGRSWGWSEENSNDLDQVSVDVVVTGWAPGTGPAAFADVVNGTGTCDFSSPQTEEDVQVVGAQDSWVASSTSNGLESTQGAARVGDLVVGVQVYGLDTSAGADRVGLLLTSITAEMAADLPEAAAGR